MSITRIRDIKNREDAIMFLKGMGIVITSDMTKEEVDDMIRSEIGLDFNIPELPMFDYSKIIIPEDTEFTETHPVLHLTEGLIVLHISMMLIICLVRKKMLSI